jgi:hypothetical protein
MASIVERTTWRKHGYPDHQAQIRFDREKWETNKPYLSEGLLVLLIRSLLFATYYYHQHIFLRLATGFLAWLPRLVSSTVLDSPRYS